MSHKFDVGDEVVIAHDNYFDYGRWLGKRVRILHVGSIAQKVQTYLVMRVADKLQLTLRAFEPDLERNLQSEGERKDDAKVDEAHTG